MQQIVFTVFDFLGLAIFIFPNIGHSLNSNSNVIRFIGAIVVVISLFLANFNLYRKYFNLRADFMDLTEYKYAPYLSLELRYLSNIEPIKIQDVKVVYLDKQDNKKEKKIDRFFPLSDLAMAGPYRISPPQLFEKDGFRFHVLLDFEDLKNADISIEVDFVGVNSEKKFKIKKDFVIPKSGRGPRGLR